MQLIVKDIIKVNYCISDYMAKALYAEIRKYLLQNEKIELSFEGIRIMTTHFSYTFWGSLFDEFGLTANDVAVNVESDIIKERIAEMQRFYNKS